MNPTTHFLDLSHGRIAFRTYGRGPTPLLALPGFSANGRIFAPLAGPLGDRFTLFAVDLPFHGETEWWQPSYGPAFLTDLRTAVLEMAGTDRCSALGYSLGARLLLTTLPDWSAHLDALFLLAPDGFGTRGMALPDRVPGAARAWLSQRLERPAPLLQLAGGLQWLGLLDRFSLIYLRHHLARPDRRERLLGTWRSLAHFPVRRKELRRQIQEAPFPIDIFTGTRDPIVSHQEIEKALGDLPGVRIHLLEEDHLLVSEKLGRKLLEIV